MGYIKLYLYIPTLQAIILLGDKSWSWLGRWEVDIFRADLISNHKNICAYLNNSTQPKVCAIIDQPHFAHHIWNTLTGLEKATKQPYSKIIDRYIVSNEPMGPIDELFPEISKKNISRVSNPNTGDLVLLDNLFALRPGGQNITTDLIKRIHRTAKQNSTPNYIQAGNNFKSQHFPILWTTIRTGNRTWISQIEGIACIANSLKKRHPNFALIIDGFSIPYGVEKTSAHTTHIIEEENKVTKAITNLLDPSIEVRIFVGETIFSSVIYANHADLYLSHHGTLQHKIAWLSNKCGVVHSNKTILQRHNNSKNYAASKATINFKQPIYLSPEVVADHHLGEEAVTS